MAKRAMHMERLFGHHHHRPYIYTSSSSSLGMQAHNCSTSPHFIPSSRNKEPSNGGIGAASPYLQKARSGKTEIRELEAVFKKFDVNGDGKISSNELGAIMASLGHEVPEEVLQKAVTEIDRKGDGYINFEEFVELNTKGMDQNEILENLKDAFSVYDIDGNGSISAEELHEVLRSLGDECSIAECRKMISGVDKDGDGTIDFEEFKIMMTLGSRRDNIMT